MADPPSYPDTSNDTGVAPGRGSTTTTPSYPGTPRWVKVSGIIAFVLVLLVVVMLVIGGGSHGPGRHTPSGGAGGYTPPTVHRVQQL